MDVEVCVVDGDVSELLNGVLCVVESVAGV